MPSTALEVHWELLYTNRIELLIIGIVSFAVYWVFAIVLKLLFDCRARQIVQKSPSAAAKTYLELSTVKKWEYIQCY